jgi:hypothetical protein
MAARPDDVPAVLALLGGLAREHADRPLRRAELNPAA